jgi:hypothetical protein
MIICAALLRFYGVMEDSPSATDEARTLIRLLLGLPHEKCTSYECEPLAEHFMSTVDDM